MKKAIAPISHIGIACGTIVSCVAAYQIATTYVPDETMCESINDTEHKQVQHQERYYKYVILGSGTSATAALESIRESDPHGEVLMVIDGQRMPRLDIGTDDDTLDGVLENIFNEWRRHLQSRMEIMPSDTSQAEAPAVVLGKTNDLKLDVEHKKIVLPDGSNVHYGACLLASTGKPRSFYVLDSAKMSYSLRGSINTMKDLAEFKDLERITKVADKKHITVVGGGFLGTEVALALADMKTRNAKDKPLEISHVFVEKNPLERHVPKYFSKYIGKKVRDAGIQTVSERVVTSVDHTGDKIVHDDAKAGRVRVNLMGWEQGMIETDYVVLASTQIQPSTKLAAKSGLEIDVSNGGGTVVNSSLQAFDGLFVAGNGASYYDPVLGRRRVQNYDHAVNSGLVAGQNMVAVATTEHLTSRPKTVQIYQHQPLFRSSLTGTGLLLEGVGIVDSKLETVGIWLAKRDENTGKPSELTEFKRGIIYYLKENRVVGILCCNASECVGMARDVLHSKKTVSDVNLLKNRIQLAPENWTKVISMPGLTEVSKK